MKRRNFGGACSNISRPVRGTAGAAIGAAIGVAIGITGATITSYFFGPPVVRYGVLPMLGAATGALIGARKADC